MGFFFTIILKGGCIILGIALSEESANIGMRIKDFKNRSVQCNGVDCIPFFGEQCTAQCVLHSDLFM